MTRVKSKAQINHRKTKKLAKGFKQARRTRIKAGKEAVMHAGQYAYVGRKLRKRDMRALWIIRISAAAKENGINYSKFIKGLKDKKIEIDRKMLSNIALKDPDTFQKIISEIK